MWYLLNIMRKVLCIFALLCFLVTSTIGSNSVFAQPALTAGGDFLLPLPGVRVHLSPEFTPPILKGIKVHPDNPFRFDFILDKGDVETQNLASLRDESTRLIKYFLASLTIPEKDLWVNLSPYEKDRIIPNSFGLTEMGRDLLAEDYMLKQVTASLIYPEDGVGKKFWRRIYEETTKKFGTTNIPVSTFNKVWIIPEKAVVYENVKAGTAFVVESKLKVMLEGDYLAIVKNSKHIDLPEIQKTSEQIIRQIVIPELTKEINQGRNFARLRQVYNSLILATWYKKKIKDSVLSKVYADKNKVVGVNVDDPREKEKIYQLYLQAFKKGVYNYIKEEIDPITQQSSPKKYFSGGITALYLDQEMREITVFSMDRAAANRRDFDIGVNLIPGFRFSDFAMQAKLGQSLKGLDQQEITKWYGECMLNLEQEGQSHFDILQIMSQRIRGAINDGEIGQHLAEDCFFEYAYHNLLIPTFSFLSVGDSFKVRKRWRERTMDEVLTDLIYHYWKEKRKEIDHVLVVAISGDNASRKSTYTENQYRLLTNKGLRLAIVNGDGYLKPRKEMRERSLEGTERIDLQLYRDDMHKLKEGKLFRPPQYIQATGDIDKESGKWIYPRSLDVIIIEGELVFSQPDINEVMDLKIFLDETFVNRFNDRVLRDATLRSYGMEEAIWHAVKMQFVLTPFVRGQIPFADIVLQNSSQKIFMREPSVAPALSDEHANLAMMSEEKGGIDFTANKTPLEIKNTGDGIKFRIDPAMLQQFEDTPGFIPVIINIEPVIDLRRFLGAVDNKFSPQMAS